MGFEWCIHRFLSVEWFRSYDRLKPPSLSKSMFSFIYSIGHVNTLCSKDKLHTFFVWLKLVGAKALKFKTTGHVKRNNIPSLLSCFYLYVLKVAKRKQMPISLRVCLSVTMNIFKYLRINYCLEKVHIN